MIFFVENFKLSFIFTLCISQNFEVLDSVEAFNGEREISGRAFADPDDEGSLVFVGQQLLGVGAGDPAVVPGVGLHLDVVAGNQT